MGTIYRSFTKFAILFALIFGHIFPSSSQYKNKIRSIHDLAKIVNQKTNQSPDYFLGHKLSNLKKKRLKSFAPTRIKKDQLANYRWMI